MIKLMKWFCKKFGHAPFSPIDKILMEMSIIEIKSIGKTDETLICPRCKQNFSIQKIYDLTHDGKKRTNKEIIKLSEVE
jgi:hypothetical protein